MSAGLVAIFLSAGVTAWVYNYLYSKTGGNRQSAGIVAGIAGVASFLITFFLFRALA